MERPWARRACASARAAALGCVCCWSSSACARVGTLAPLGPKQIVNLQVIEPLEHWQATFRVDGPSSESSASRISSGCSAMMMQWQASRSESTLVGSSTTALRKSTAHVFSTC